MDRFICSIYSNNQGRKSIPKSGSAVFGFPGIKNVPTAIVEVRYYKYSRGGRWSVLKLEVKAQHSVRRHLLASNEKILNNKSL
jgi:hypothetical protein